MAFLVRFLWRNLKGYRFLVILIFLATIFEVLASSYGIVVFKDIVNVLSPPKPTPANPHPSEPSFPFFLVLNRYSPAPHSNTLIITYLLIVLVVLGILDALLIYFQLFLTSRVSQNLSARLRKKLFDQLQRLSLDWHGKQKKGDLVQRITGDIANVEKVVTDGLVDMLADILILLLAVFIMVTNQWQLAIGIVVLLPALFVTIIAYQKGIKAAAKRASKSLGEVADVAAEDVGAITVLKAFSLEDREAIRFNKYVGKSRQAGLDAGGLQAQFTPVVNVLVTLGTAFIIGMGAFGLLNGKFPIINVPVNPVISVGTLTLFLGFLAKFFQPMKDLAKLSNVATSAAAGAERMQEVLDQAPELTESTVPYNGPQRLKGDILFQNVVFGYSPERPILKGINLHIAAGKKVALVGLSGGGKTTLIKLIPRFYEVNQGNVRIDGIDNRTIPLALLRRNVSQVLQESVLFEGTILENIKLGRPEATYDEIVAATKQAQIHDTIMALPEGYETRVRERGKNFSGGQRQRLAIARAILTNSPILVLDEPTASLDVEAEVEVLRAIDTLVVGRTVLMISHRLSTLGNVDEIIVLKDGRIAEQGNYQELKRQNGVFAGLLKEQNRYNVDYHGGSMIVPRAEFDRLMKQQGQGARLPQPPSPAPLPPNRPGPVHVPPARDPYAFGGNSNGNPSQQLNARVFIEVDGKIVGQRLLDKPVLTVGRLSGNDIQVPSQRVSRLHAKIRWENSAWVIDDAESLNGLVIRGQLVERHVLSNGDRVHVAPAAVIRFELIP